MDDARLLIALKAVEDAARELMSWDWRNLLVDHPDAQSVMDDVRKLDHALRDLDTGTGR